MSDRVSPEDVENFVASYVTIMHHGVKGMKWGVHRAKGHVSGNEVRAARARLHSDLDSIEHHAAAIRTAGSTAEKNRHLAAIHAIANKSLKNGDDDKGTRSTARSHLGSGLAGTAILPGIGTGAVLAAHAAYKHKQFQDTHELLNKHASSTLKDY